jgi:ribosome-associated protein
MHEEESNKNLYDEPSKSQLKREQQAIQNLIADLIALPMDQIENLLTDARLRHEIKVAAAMKPSSSRNRQIRHITKLAASDSELLDVFEKLVEKTQAAKKQQADKLHEIEYWRDKILSGTDNEFTEFADRYHLTDLQQLRQMRREYQKIALAQKPNTEQKQKELGRKVFKLVSDSIRGSEA